MNKERLMQCPHCGDFVLIEKINCGIFRHGILKATGKQISPHAPKTLCDYFVEREMIYGCGKPFRVFRDVRGRQTIEICEYV
jgi:hypothetical protein